jgi:Ca-activated chloride channel homolog
MMFRACRLVSLVLVSTLCCLGRPHVLQAQSCGTCSSSDRDGSGVSDGKPSGSLGRQAEGAKDEWIIHSRVVEVTVSFIVTKGHKPVMDLKKQEISVLDDDAPASKISAFGHLSDLPLRMGLLIDTSDSVRYQLNFEQDASNLFLEKVVRPKVDRAFVMAFSVDRQLVQDYTDDTSRLRDGIAALRAEGRTAVFDAVRAACTKLWNFPDAALTSRILIVLSDGEDNSSKSTLQEAIDAAQRAQVTVYTISTNRKSFGGSGDHVLKELASQTGGRVFWPTDAKHMEQAFSQVENDMRHRYALAYEPPVNLREDGGFHRIQIKAQRSREKFHVYARKGYYASATRAEADAQPDPGLSR